MGVWARARRGTWRVAVVEDSMTPAIVPGDWLLLDPTGGRWPGIGSVVVFREPDTDLLAIKRVVARGGMHVPIDEGLLHLERDEAWLLGDAEGRSVDSRQYGPVAYDRFVGRVWFRYGPLRRIGPLQARRASNGPSADHPTVVAGAAGHGVVGADAEATTPSSTERMSEQHASVRDDP